MKIGIIGNGVVGSATGKALAGYADVLAWDISPDRSKCELSSALACDLIMVCLPTPQVKDSLVCDTSIVEEFFRAFLLDEDRGKNFVLRSTVPVGTTRRLSKEYRLPNLVHWPEFLTARTAEQDVVNPTRLIIGYPEGIANCSPLLFNMCRRRWSELRPYVMLSDESEAVKLFQNAFSAVKVACFNEFRCYADAVNLNWNRVLGALLAGGWINPIHTQVPGPDGKYGFGGTCLPKDTANLAACMQAGDVSPLMLLAAIVRNADDRKR